MQEIERLNSLYQRATDTTGMAQEDAATKFATLESEFAAERRALEHRLVAQHEDMMAAEVDLRRVIEEAAAKEAVLKARVDEEGKWEEKYNSHLTEVHEVTVQNAHDARKKVAQAAKTNASLTWKLQAAEKKAARTGPCLGSE